MFYCKECQEKNDWPEGYRMSYGPCEECGKMAGCYDIPSSYLSYFKSRKEDAKDGEDV